MKNIIDRTDRQVPLQFHRSPHIRIFSESTRHVIFISIGASSVAASLVQGMRYAPQSLNWRYLSMSKHNVLYSTSSTCLSRKAYITSGLYLGMYLHTNSEILHVRYGELTTHRVDLGAYCLDL